MTGCPIYGKMLEAYNKGIVYLKQYFKRKWDRYVYKVIIKQLINYKEIDM